MTTLHLTSHISSLLQVEIDAIEKTREELLLQLFNSKSAPDFFNHFIKNIYGKEFKSRVQKLSRGINLKILDIGFGRGESSLYLGYCGHQVHAIEPSSLNCEVLEKASRQFSIPIQIYQGIAEDIDRIVESDFDVCIFHSSLHHCDEPVRALSNCLKKLSPNGKALVINEPLLKFYRTKKWFEKKMRENPISVGHYGGNEHIYYYHEYIRIFKESGFKKIRSLHHIRHKYPRQTIRFDMDKMIQNQPVNSDSKILIKYGLLLLLKSLLRKDRGPIQAIFKFLSLVPITFELEK